MKNLLRSVLIGTSLLGLGFEAAQADSAKYPSVQFSVFGTLGVARQTEEPVQYVRDLSQREGLSKRWSSEIDSVLGAQANIRLGSQTEAVIQTLSRYRYDGTYRPEISWAFLRHDITPEVRARIGRLGTEFYMQSDSRLVGYANTSVRPPPDFFGPLIFAYFDGVDIAGELPLGSGLMSGKLFYGRSPESSPFYGTVPWHLDGTKLLGGYLDYQNGRWQFRLGHMLVRFGGDELPLANLSDAVLTQAGAPLAFLVPWPITRAIPEMATRNSDTRFDSLGVVYDHGPLRVHGMIGRIAYETESYEDNLAGFISASYRIGNLTPYAGYSRTRSKATQVSTVPNSGFGPQVDLGLLHLARMLTKATHTDQHTTTLGLRWDFHPNMDLKFQWDEIRGAEDSLFAFRGSSQNWDGHMRVISVAFDFAF